MNEYYVPASDASAEFIERKSRFIGTIWRVETEEEALAHIKEMNEKHRDATHNVYAYIIKENNIMRYSDNGEPQGTAGMPTLEVLRREGITNVLCVVTRYFGGILLGAGGLVRAYAHSAKIALDAAGVSVMRQWTQMLLEAPYNWQERVKLRIEEKGGIIESTEFGASVLFDICVPSENIDEFTADMIDFTNGIVSPIPMGDKFMGVRIR